MSDLETWVIDTAAGRGIVRVWAPSRLASLLASDGIEATNEHPERPWCVVVELDDGTETACNPGV
jgi:hypothetical protein